MNKQILFLLVLLFVTFASAGPCILGDSQQCNDYCIVHVSNSNGVKAKGGKCGGLLNLTCQCTY